jgi:hypothetical protein
VSASRTRGASTVINSVGATPLAVRTNSRSCSSVRRLNQRVADARLRQVELARRTAHVPFAVDRIENPQQIQVDIVDIHGTNIRSNAHRVVQENGWT